MHKKLCDANFTFYRDTVATFYAVNHHSHIITLPTKRKFETSNYSISNGKICSCRMYGEGRNLCAWEIKSLSHVVVDKKVMEYQNAVTWI